MCLKIKKGRKFMNKQEFYNNVVEGIKERLGNDFQIKVNEVVKVNMTLDGLTIMGKMEHIAPTIYLNDYKRQFDAGRSLESILEELISIYKNNRNPDILPAENYFDFELLKDKIVIKVIGTEKNEQFLKETPHIPMENLNLAAYFYVMLSSDSEGSLGFPLKENHLKLWNTTVAELLPLATENTNRMYHFVIRNIEEVVSEMLTGEKKQEDSIDFFSLAMYVLTDKDRSCMGSSALFLKDKIKEFSDKCDCDVFILPSSIHELILLNANLPDVDVSHLKDMVKEINATQVSEDEFLSDNVYYYSRKKDAISRL